MSLLLCAQVDKLEQWQRELAAAFPGEPLAVWPAVPDPAAVRIALVAKPPRGALTGFPNLELICSLWAGVDGLLADPTLPRHVSLTRLIDPQLTAAIVESVLLHVLSAHRLAPRYRLQQARVEWRQHDQLSAAERTVGILGFGELGRACAEALLPLGFRVLGWSRSARSHPRVDWRSFERSKAPRQDLFHQCARYAVVGKRAIVGALAATALRTYSRRPPARMTFRVSSSCSARA